MQLVPLDSYGDTLQVSLDMTDDAGASKLSDDCGGGGGGISTYPTLSALASGSTPGKGTLSAAKALPAGMPNGGFGNGAVAGPNGDVFYYGMDTSSDLTQVQPDWCRKVIKWRIVVVMPNPL